MAALGFTGIDEEKQFAMAVHDVTLEFARQMKAEKLTDLDTDKLIAFRIFDVNRSSSSARCAPKALPAKDSRQTHRVPRAWRDARDGARARGRPGSQLDEDQLIAFRMHGVTPEFIAKVEALGFKDPEPDQLVAMRVHGVTPEYIAEMKSRGMKDLTIDKLVNLRVHGID